MSIKLSGKKFATWTRKKFRKENTMKIVFSDEKMFDLNGIYNSENDRIWAGNRERANRRAGKKYQGKFAEKVMVGYPYVQRALRSLFCLEKALSIIIVTSKKYCLLLYDTETTETSTKTTKQHILTKKRKTGVPNIY